MKPLILTFCLLISFPAQAFVPEGFAGAFPWSFVSSTPAISDLNDPALFPVSREFGPAKIPLGSLPFDSQLAEARVRPWSSYWFPRAERHLFENSDGLSPLEKYDLVRSTITGIRSQAAEEEKRTFRAGVARWEGLCDAWAIASILFPEPAAPRTLQLDGGAHGFRNKRIQFGVGDQKALLLKSLEAVSTDSLKVYGQKFRGDFDGWIFPDLYPQELHRLVEVQLFERRQPFIMDHDPGVEVWSEPVFKANYKVFPVEGRADAVFVRLWLYSAGPLRIAEKDRAGTKEVVREYNYYLYGEPDGAGNLVVNSGEWAKGEIVDSRRDHPDFVFIIPDPALVERASYNKEIDPLIVDQILGL